MERSIKNRIEVMLRGTRFAPARSSDTPAENRSDQRGMSGSSARTRLDSSPPASWFRPLRRRPNCSLGVELPHHRLELLQQRRRDGVQRAGGSGRQRAVADLLFILHDAGESLAVRRTVEAFAANESTSVAVLALGEPAHSMFAGAANVSVHTPASLGLHVHIVDGAARNATLSEGAVAHILARLGRPPVVVAGMAYEMQAQLARAFRDDGSGDASARHPPSYSVAIDDAIGQPWDPKRTTALRRSCLLAGSASTCRHPRRL